jgi:hypothetical protein
MVNVKSRGNWKGNDQMVSEFPGFQLLLSTLNFLVLGTLIIFLIFLPQQNTEKETFAELVVSKN